MKKLIYISGIISAYYITFGSSFKIQHWPGAGVLLSISITFFALFFIPAALLNNFKHEKKNAYLYISIFITLLINFAAALFKIHALARCRYPGYGRIDCSFYNISSSLYSLL